MNSFWRFVTGKCRFSYNLSYTLTSTLNRKRITQGVTRFFNNNYELRYNVLKQVEEFRPISRRDDLLGSKGDLLGAKGDLLGAKGDLYDSKGDLLGAKGDLLSAADGWQPLTDRHLRRIAFEQMAQEGVAWCVDVELFVRSSLTPDFNPVADFLAACGAWDGQTDYIRQLAARVPTKYAAWPDVFHRWFLAMVAQWQQLSRDYGNALVPLLIGRQGTHKSTFCRLLLPPQLREYYIDDIKLDNAEQVERMLARMLLVNIDEYNAKTDREQSKIKRVLTEKDVQTRRMRSDQYIMLPRMASFVATTNDPQPLNDPTGSRRYLCCEVEGVIDTDTPIDYRQLYAQAVEELRSGERYHLTKAEERDVEVHNTLYRSQSSPESLLLAFYEPAKRTRKFFVRSIDIQAELRKHLRAADVPNVKQLGLALRSAGFASGAIQGQRGWYARLKASE